MMNESILVTGATGFIGASLVRDMPPFEGRSDAL